MTHTTPPVRSTSLRPRRPPGRRLPVGSRGAREHAAHAQHAADPLHRARVGRAVLPSRPGRDADRAHRRPAPRSGAATPSDRSIRTSRPSTSTWSCTAMDRPQPGPPPSSRAAGSRASAPGARSPWIPTPTGTCSPATTPPSRPAWPWPPRCSTVTAATPTGPSWCSRSTDRTTSSGRRHPTGARCPCSWLHRAGGDPASGAQLVAALAAVPLPPGTGHAYLAGELGVVAAMRQALLARGLEADQISAKPYWRVGRANAAHGEPERP